MKFNGAEGNTVTKCCTDVVEQEGRLSGASYRTKI